MNQVQEIIVYRNPGEKAVWDLLMSGPGLFYVIVFLIVMAAGVSFSRGFLSKQIVRLVGWQHEGWIHLVIGSALGALAVWYLYV